MIKITFDIDDSFQPALDKFASLGYKPEDPLLDRLNPIQDEIDQVKNDKLIATLKLFTPEDKAIVDTLAEKYNPDVQVEDGDVAP